jgi:PAS domain S-box-containing protein
MVQSTRTILVVDDSPEDRELYRRYLLHDRKYSYQILEASLGRQGLELWQQHQPDAVLLDYRLPDLDGLEFLSHLQSLLQQTHLPAIVITGQGSEAVAVQAMKAGAQDYLVKEQLSSESLRVALNSTITNVELRHRLHRSEEALQQSEERFRRILESSSDCITLLDLDGQILYVNPGGLYLLESEDTSLYLNANWFCFWQEDDRTAAKTAIATAKAGETSRFRGFYPTAKGTPKWWDVVVTPILNPGGQVIQLLATSRDVTEQKQAEQERDRLLQLEQTARLAAERANRIKDEFLSVLSHELRSPLNPILGWAKLMQTRKFDAAKTAEALSTIERNAKLQCQLIDDLLDVAKILQGKLSMEVVPVDLAFVIEAAIDTVKAAAVAKNILLHPVLPHIGQVSGDATRLQQIVWNLLSNAIKFTPTGGRVEIRLSAEGSGESGIRNREENAHSRRPTPDAPTYAQITVSDTGKGINPDFLPYIFESFRQEDASTTRKYGGLGLGLAIVRQLVEAQGGTIRADSQGEGQGAVFTLRLPLLHAELEQRQPEDSSNQEPDLTGVRVLTVDDEPDTRELVTVLLTQYGAEVLTVDSAAEVLASLAAFQPDILISDIGMPEVDGYSLIRQIRALPAEEGGQVAAIALSAYAREEDRQQAIMSGYQSHMTKPFEPEQFVRAITALV